MGYQLFTDATADMCDAMLAGLPHIEIIPMEVLVGDIDYLYGPRGNLSVDEFYAMQREGKFASTSQISPDTYRSAFEPYLQKGQDILYLAFSSGMSGTINSARLCARELMEDYPNRKICCVDTLCASVGEGFLVREVARKQAEGLELDKLVEWIEEQRLKVCHWFTVDTFQHLLHGGRVSAVSAAAGTVLNIKPLLHVDEEGKLKVMEKPRGHKYALRAKLEHMEQGWNQELGKLVVVGHADCPEVGKELCEQVREQFPEAEIIMADIGPVIGAHTGPGMSAVIYWGNNR